MGSKSLEGNILAEGTLSSEWPKKGKIDMNHNRDHDGDLLCDLKGLVSQDRMR